MEKDQRLVKIHDTLKDQQGMGSHLGTKSDTSYDNLQKNLDNALTNLSLKSTWDDAISAEINGVTRTGIEAMITACKMPAGEIIRQVSGKVDTLVSGIKNYIDQVDYYNEIEKQRNQIGTTCPSSHYTNEEGQSIRNPDYDRWNELTGTMQTIEVDVARYKENCESLINNIQGLLSTIGSQSSQAALEASIGTTQSYEGSDLLSEFGYDDTYTITGVVNKDANGKKISETYYIKNQNGEIVQSGYITYDENQIPNIQEHIIKSDEPSTEEEIAKALEKAEEKGEISQAAYLDEEMTPEKENISSDTDITGENFKTTENVQREFSDGTTVNSQKQTNGIVEENEEGPELVPTDSHTEGTIICLGDTEYDYSQDEYFSKGKLKTRATEIKQGEETVSTIDEEFLADYVDSITGHNVTATSETATTNNITTTTNSVVYKTSADGEVYSETVQMVRNLQDPMIGSVTYEDGTVYEVTRNEQGQYIKTERTPDKNGEIVEESEIIDSNSNATLTITSQDGTVTTMNINIANPLDQYTVESIYQTARIDAGYKPEYSMEGIHHLWLGNGENVVVQGIMQSDPAIIFNLKLND